MALQTSFGSGLVPRSRNVTMSGSPEELDRAEGDAYTPREMTFCAVGSAYYADAVGEFGT